MHLVDLHGEGQDSVWRGFAMFSGAGVASESASGDPTGAKEEWSGKVGQFANPLNLLVAHKLPK